MKTKTFKESRFQRSESFKRDVKMLAEVSPEQLRAAASWFTSLEYAHHIWDTRDEKRKAWDEKIFRGEKTKAYDILSLVAFLLSKACDNRDKSEDLVQDLVDQELLKPEAVSRVKDFFQKIWPQYEVIKTVTRRVALATQAGWSLDRAEITCSMKSLISNPFRLDEDKIETYEPEIVDYEPAVAVRMMLAKDDETEVVDLELTTKGLDRFITKLQAARIELRALEKGKASLTKK